MIYNNVSIKGIGSYLPDKVLTNQEIEAKINTTHTWIKNKLGIDERRIAEELPSEMGFRAAKKALKSANLNIEDIDLIIVATSSPEKISPSTACTIHSKFNIDKNIPAFDINAVCSGFIYALNLMIPLVSYGTYKNVLIIATEAYSNFTDWNNQHCVFFGDGAGAVVLGYDKEGWMSFENEANGKNTGMTGFNMPNNGYFIMKGKEVWEQAIKVLPNSIKNVLNKAKINIKNVDMLIPHQPSINILKIVANEIGLPINKVKTVMDKYANIAGASIPIALDDAVMNNQISKGNIIVFTAIGSGWAWGSTVMKWTK